MKPIEILCIALGVLLFALGIFCVLYANPQMGLTATVAGTSVLSIAGTHLSVLHTLRKLEDEEQNTSK